MLRRIIFGSLACCLCLSAMAQDLPDLTFENIEFWPVANTVNIAKYLLEDEQGFLWIGSNAGLYRYDGHSIKNYFHDADSNSINEFRIHDIYQDSLGNVWIGTAQGGLNRYVREFDHFQQLIPPDGSWAGFGQSVYTQAIAEEQIHWIPTTHGIIRYVASSNTFTTHRPITPPRYPQGYGFRFVIPDRVNSDILWSGGLNGFYKYNIAVDSFQFIPMQHAETVEQGYYMLHDMFYMTDGLLCGGSWGGGVMCHSIEDGSWQQFIYEPLLFTDYQNVVLSILPEDSRTLWIAAVRGFGQLDVATGAYTFYDWNNQDHASIDSSFMYSSLIKLRQDRIAVTRQNGFSISSPVNGKSDQLHFNPLLSEIHVDGALYHTDTAFHYLNGITLSGDDQDVSFTFITPGNYSSDPITFNYKLEGYDRDWQSIDEGRVARYTNLPKGSFEFAFRASLDGVSWKEGLSIRVVRQVYFWKTTWFLIACLALALTVIGSIYWLNLRAIRREAALKTEFSQKLAEVELQVLRAQMNPHFMFNSLNAIKHYILTQEPLKASEYLTNFATLIRLILHNSREKLITVSKELEALTLYTELEQLRFNGKFELHCRITEQVDLDKVLIPPLILQPYVENAIWHGLMHKRNQGTLSIEMTRENGTLRCIIEDDGIGREAANRLKSKSATRHKSMGMGITHERIIIHNRMNELGIHVTIEDKHDASNSPRGTKVIIDIPINHGN